MKSNINKILVISPYFHPHIGGSQQYMEDLYASLINNHQEIKVDILTYNTEHANKEEVYRGLKVHRIQCWEILPGQFAIPHPFQLLNFFLQNIDNYQLIHCNTRFFESSWWAPIIAKIFKKPIYLTDHCAFHPTHTNHLIQFLTKVVDLSIVKIALKGFDKVFSTNQSTQKFLKDTYGLNSAVIYGGVNINIFKPSQNRKTNQRVKILYAARMIPSKGPQYLLNAALQFPEADFIFAGPGPLVNVYKKTAPKNVKILGPLSKERLSKLMQTVDIFAHPSVHHEGFPNSILEAGASKLAVIATNVGGTNEIITSQTGILVQPNNQNDLNKAISTLINNPDKRKNYAKQLYGLITKNFTWKNSVKQFYLELVK